MKKKHSLIPLLMMFSVSGCVMYNGLPKEEAEHEHTYAETYSFNETDHWFAATCEHTDITKGKENHSFGEYVTTQEPTLYAEGLKVRTCSICGYKDEVKLDKLIDGGGSGEQGGGGSQIDPPETWDITALNVDRENIELTVGDAPITIVPRLVGEGNFPASITIECKDGSRIETVDGEEITKTYKVANVNRNVVESGSGFTVSAVSAGSTQIVLTSSGKPTVTKTIEVNVLAKPEVHELTISDENLTVNKGSYTVLSSNSTDDVTWNSSDDSIICLENKTNSGVWLKAIKSSGEGTVTITATICAGTSNEIVKTCIVTVVSNEQTVFDYYYINNQKLTDLYVYLWGANGSNAAWPGVALGEADYINKDLNEVYKITIDKDLNDFDKLIISGKDSIGDLQTDDIVLASFVTQNAFTIPSIPNDVVDGVRKASIRMGNFNPSEDTLSGSYITLSMNDANLIVGDEIYVYCYTNANEVDYTVTSGDDKIQLVNETYNGFTIRALAAGEADIEAKVVSGESSGTTHLHVTVIDDEIVTYYFANNYQWKNLKVYMWGKHENAEYPGKLFAHAPVKNKDNVNTYEVSFSKYSDGYTGMVISGTDENKGSCKTQDIYFADLDRASKNMIYITETEWTNSSPIGEGAVQYTCSVGTDVFESAAPKIEVSQSNITMVVGQTVDIPVDTNSEYEIINSDDTVIEATKAADKITVKGLKEGSATITAKVNDDVKDTITISVVEDYEVSYYFANNYNWSDLKVYMWNDTLGTENAPYPGVSLGERSFIDINGDYIYKISYNRYADNYEGFIITGNDGEKGEGCKTENVYFANFADNNGIKLTGWTGESGKTATFSFGFYVYELYLNISSTLEFAVGASIPLTVKTNGENVSYQVTSGSDVIELQNESDTGVTVKGLAAGTATFTATVSDGKNTVTKTIQVSVISNEQDEDIIYYFSNNYCWSNLSVHLWKSETEYKNISLTSTSLKNKEGQDVYAFSFKKIAEGYTGMVIMGHDDTYGDVQTVDISVSSFGENNNVYLTGWDAENPAKATVGYASYDPNFVEISEGSPKIIRKNQTFEIKVNSNHDVSYSVENGGIIEIHRVGNDFEIEGIASGEETISFFNGTEDNKINVKTYTVIVDDTPVSDYQYTVNNVPDWYGNDNYDVYAWAYGGSVPGDGTWIKGVFNGTTFTFTSSYGDIEHCVLLRCPHDSTPTWPSVPDNEKGGFQSGNINFSNYVGNFVNFGV